MLRRKEKQKTDTVKTTYLSESGRRAALFLVTLLCGIASHSIAHAGTSASHSAGASTVNSQHGHVLHHPLVLTLDPSSMDSPGLHRQYVGFAGSQPGYGARELDVRSAVLPSTAGSISFPIAWEKKSDIERAVRNFKQNGLPIVRLWGSGRSSLALGVNPKRVPGIYFTQTIPN
jgi:hypothetical protein